MSAERMCEGRVCIVTGAGRGLGREYSLSLARHGAKVLVNDLGAGRDGSGSDAGPAQEVVEEGGQLSVVGVARLRQRQAHGDHTVGIETGVDVAQLQEGADEKPGADQVTTAHPSGFGVIDGGRTRSRRHPKAKTSGSFMERVEERWRRRKGGRGY